MAVYNPSPEDIWISVAAKYYLGRTLGMFQGGRSTSLARWTLFPQGTLREAQRASE